MATAAQIRSDAEPGGAAPWKGAVAALLVACAYGPLLVEYFTNLWQKPYYQHFPFVLVAFAWLVGSRTRLDPQARWNESVAARAGAALLAMAAWGLLALAYWVFSPWLGFVSLVLLVAALLAALPVNSEGHGAIGAWLLLWLMVPLPQNRDYELVAMLQRMSSRASSFVLDSLGILHAMDGNTLTLAGKRFFVDEACSGIISVMSIVACAAIYGVWRGRSAAHVLLLIVAGICWATVMNTVRISSIAWVFNGWNVDWSTGAVHEALSLFIFTITFAALISTDALLAVVMAPIGPAWLARFGDPIGWGRSLAEVWDRGLADVETDAAAGLGGAPAASRGPAKDARRRPPWGVVAALALLFAVLPAVHFGRAQTPRGESTAKKSEVFAQVLNRALAIDQPFLPERVGDLQQVRFFSQERTREDALGNHSRSHEFADDRGVRYLASCDFAYEDGWHELTICYQGVGWTLDSREVLLDPPTDGQPAWPRMEATFTRPGSRYAYLVVCAFDEAGNPVELPTQSLAEDAMSVFTRNAGPRHAYAFQTQVWLTSAAPPDDEMKAAAHLLMITARKAFKEIVVGGAPVPPAPAGAAQNAVSSTKATNPGLTTAQAAQQVPRP
ncbi:MAG TPA: exosortase U [Lacipirellulaceae bacterium]|nr:exosortase U [Lacipirellulaceae bacterium]